MLLECLAGSLEFGVEVGELVACDVGDELSLVALHGLFAEVARGEEEPARVCGLSLWPSTATTLVRYVQAVLVPQTVVIRFWHKTFF